MNSVIQDDIEQLQYCVLVGDIRSNSLRQVIISSFFFVSFAYLWNRSSTIIGRTASTQSGCLYFG